MTISHTQLQGFRTSRVSNSSGDEYNHHLANISQQLSNIDQKAMVKGDDVFQDFLDALDPNLDTLPYLFVLFAQINAASEKKTAPGTPLWMRMMDFLESFNPVEVRYAGREWRFIVETVASRARAAKEPVLALQPISNALLQVDPSRGSFTSLHLCFIQLCLEAGAFVEATLILQYDIHAFPSTPIVGMTDMNLHSDHQWMHGFMNQTYNLTGVVTPAEVQEFHLLGAMIYIGMKNWERAMYYLELLLSIPTNNCTNVLMVEAYRKWILVSLLVHGSVKSAPKTTSSNSLKTLKSVGKVYESIADAFKLADRRKLHAEVLQAQDILQQDGNLGLAQEVFRYHQKLFVINLQKTYATVPISTLAKKLDQPITQTESILRFYIEEGSLSAKIERGPDGSPEFLRFAENSGSAESEAELRTQLLEQTHKLRVLAEHVTEADRRMGLTKEYIDHARKLRKSKQLRSNSDDDAMDLYEVSQELRQDVDEDMMADDA